MSDKPEITQKQIQSRAASQSFSRGKTLYSSASISNTVRRGDEIEARCKGSYPEPYRVWAKFNNSEIAAAGCNCEYDWGGDCKHIVAMLLTYLHQPERFDERQTLYDALISRNKEDLVDIIVLMVTRYPDLQNIVDHPTPNEIATGMIPLDTLSFRQELRDAFDGYDYEDYYESGDFAPSQAMNQVASVADRLAQRGDWLNAAVVYRTILEEFSEMDDGYFYPHDDLYTSIYDITSALEQCLTQSAINENDDEHRAILHALLGVFIWDMHMGGYGLSDEMPELILRFIRREDIASIRERVEKTRDKQLHRQSGNWGAEAYNEFLADLDMLDEVDPEIILERLRTQGMYHLLINKLLDLKRSEEAVKVVRQHLPGRYERIKALTLFIDFNHADFALQIAEEGLTTSFDVEVVSWLIDMYHERNNQEKLLHWRQIMMKHQPLAVNYDQLKQTAQALKQWEIIRPQIIADLQQKQEFDVLTRAYLLDEEWALAWETLPKAKSTGRLLDFTVAKESHHIMPAQAIPVYIKYARKAIDNRYRDQYAVAATLLATVQKMYEQIDEIEKWEQLITGIRTEFKTLRALKDELNKAGL